MASDERRCRKHPSMPHGGVCPHCLRDRLLRLCPNCACTRPCLCASSSTSPSSSSSASGSTVGRVCSHIERDRRIGRSRSVAASEGIGDDRRRSRIWGRWVSFRKPAAPRGEGEEDAQVEGALPRSTSVSAKAGGWGRFLSGPIKALRHRKSSLAGGDHQDSVR